MWEATLLLCMLGGQQCLLIQDTQGPHTTQARCEARLAEMRAEPALLSLALLSLVRLNDMSGPLIGRSECREVPAA